MRFQLKLHGFDAIVISRGLAAPIGRSPHHHAISVAQAKGVPLDPDKRAAAVSGADIAMASAIFVMDAGHRREMQQRFPTAVGKTFLLGQWQNQEIIDPINLPVEAFEMAWELCAAGVQEWIKRMHDAGMLHAATVA